MCDQSLRDSMKIDVMVRLDIKYRVLSPETQGVYIRALGLLDTKNSPREKWGSWDPRKEKPWDLGSNTKSSKSGFLVASSEDVLMTRHALLSCGGGKIA